MVRCFFYLISLEIFSDLWYTYTISLLIGLFNEISILFKGENHAL